MNGWTYDALNRAVTTGGPSTGSGQHTANAYNADGVLVQQGTTRYTQDLAAPLSQILGDGTSTYIYGQERLYAQGGGGAQLWYATDALGRVRQTLNASGAVLGNVAYDPWGQAQSGTVPTFGFTGELQQGSNVYLRARWYNGRNGTFTSRDSFAGMPEQPYSLMPYQYAYSAPTTWTDASGRAVSDGGDGGYGPCPAGQARFGGRCVPVGMGGGRGGGWTAPLTQAGGVVTVPYTGDTIRLYPNTGPTQPLVPKGSPAPEVTPGGPSVWFGRVYFFLGMAMMLAGDTPTDLPQTTTTKSRELQVIVELGAGDYSNARAMKIRFPTARVIATNSREEWEQGKAFAEAGIPSNDLINVVRPINWASWYVRILATGGANEDQSAHARTDHQDPRPCSERRADGRSSLP